ncbi:MAG TPA: hypothetical protein PLB64_01700, partial [Kiritimatiellia bacterium]|nr:hypothetical protein [Kiritimatiellia bacterium]
EFALECPVPAERVRNALLENIMLDVMFEAPRRKPGSTCVISDAVVRGHASALDAVGPSVLPGPSKSAAKPLEAAG